jgi:hypothetical protein
LDDPLPNLCPVIPISNQDGHQAKNIKKGDDILKESFMFIESCMYKSVLGKINKLPKKKFGYDIHLGRRYEMSDTLLEGDHQRNEIF